MKIIDLTGDSSDEDSSSPIKGLTRVGQDILTSHTSTSFSSTSRNRTSIASSNLNQLSGTDIHAPRNHLENSDGSRTITRTPIEGVGSFLAPITKSSVERRRPRITSTNTSLASTHSVSKPATNGAIGKTSSSSANIEPRRLDRASTTSSSRPLTSRDDRSTSPRTLQKDALSRREVRTNNHQLWGTLAENNHRPSQKIGSMAVTPSTVAKEKLSPRCHPDTQPFGFEGARRIIANTPEPDQESSLDYGSVVLGHSTRQGEGKSREGSVPLSPVPDTTLNKDYLIYERHKSDGGLPRIEVTGTPEPELDLDKISGLMSELRQDAGPRKDVSISPLSLFFSSGHSNMVFVGYHSGL
ncbi:hypothetical protein BJ875DRAFT_192368 [Amylocarpus encephaloides]|uniref:Uncharacterized protein n=1 Tax=Amylocarpus encephaloides TaxID=45428 RepID=A0A9P7Y8Z5_9HELO|nr:hypothetical protein BJ875DRAFT_192368 [Amylocarpus encephaloides]